MVQWQWLQSNVAEFEEHNLATYENDLRKVDYSFERNSFKEGQKLVFCFGYFNFLKTTVTLMKKII
jgi:hypothetical protein